MREAVCAPRNGELVTTVTAADRFGRWTTDTASITADNIVPWSVLTPQWPDPTSTNTVTLAGEAYDEAPGRVAGVDYRLNGGEWTSVTLTQSPADSTTEPFTIRLEGLPDGVHTVEVRVADHVGNVETGDFTSDTFEVDTFGPIIEAVTFENLTTGREEYVKDGDRVRVHAYLAGDTDLVPEQIRADLTRLGGPDDAAAETYDEPIATWLVPAVDTGLSDGWTTVTAVDDAGNWGSGAGAILADNTPPSSVIRLNEPNPIAGRYPKLDGTATDTAPGRVRNVEYRVDGGPWMAAYSKDGVLLDGGFDSAREEYGIRHLLAEDGTYYFEVRAADWAGNVQPPPYDGTTVTRVRALAPDIERAKLENMDMMEIDPRCIDWVRDGSNARLTATLLDLAQEPELGRAVPTSAAVHADLGNFGLPDDVAPDTEEDGGLTLRWHFRAPVTMPRDGVVEAQVWTDDFPDRRIMTRIGSDNTSPTVVLDPLEAAPVTSGEVRLTGRVRDDAPGGGIGSGIGQIWYHVEGDTTRRSVHLPGGEPYARGEAEFWIETPELADGEHTVFVYASDRIGNVGVTSRTVAVDRSAPALKDVVVTDLDIPSTTMTRDLHRATVRVTITDPHTTRGQIHADLSRLGGGADVTAEDYDLVHAWWTVGSTQTDPRDGLVAVPVWIEWPDGRRADAEGSIMADNTGPVMVIDHPTSFTWFREALVPLAWSTRDHDLKTSRGVATVTSFDLVSTTHSVTDGAGVTTEGRWLLEVAGRDWALNDGETTAAAFGLDPRRPWAALDGAPALTSATAVVVRGTAGDGPNESGLASVFYTLDGGTSQSVTALDGESGAFSISLDGLGEGFHTVRAWSFDGAGNRSDETSMTFEVDLTPPDLFITEPEGGLWYNAPVTVAWAGTAADLETSFGVAAWSPIPFGEGEGPVGAGALVSGEAVGAQGTWTVTAWAWDRAGNMSAPAQVTFRIDLGPPGLAVPGASRTRLDHITLTGTAWDGPEESGVAAVEWRQDGGEGGTGGADGEGGEGGAGGEGDGGAGEAEGAWSPGVFSAATGGVVFEVTGLEEETTCIVRLRAHDAAGNASPEAAHEVVIDRTGPAVVFTEPEDGQWYGAPARVVWETADADLASSAGLAEWRDLVTTAAGEVALASGDLVTSEGLYHARARGEDDLDNTGEEAEVAFQVDLTPPVALLDPIVPSPTGSSLVTCTGAAHDGNGSGITAVHVRVNGEDGPGEWTTVTALQEAPEPAAPTRVAYSVDLTLPTGVHQVEARAADRVGHLSPIVAREVAVDLVPPDIEILVPAGQARLGDLVEVMAEVTDCFTGVSTETVRFRFGGEGDWTAFASDDAGVTWSAVVDSWTLPDGPVALQVAAQDVVGNAGLTSRTVVIDNDYPPQRPSGLRAAYVSYREVEVSWNKNTDPDMKHYNLYRRVRESGARITDDDLRTTGLPDTPSDGPNTWLDDVDHLTAPEYWDYAMTAVDLADNSSTFSRTITVPRPDPPGDLRAVGRDSVVELEWRPVEEGFVKGYVVYRQAPGESGFTSHTTVLGRLSTSVLDTSVTNHLTYRYHVRAFDGAHNESVPSNRAEATPGAVATLRESMLTMFEDMTHKGDNDWDFNDVGAKVTATFHLTPEDHVATITLEATGVVGDDTGYDHDLWLAFSGFRGTAAYTVTRYTKTGALLGSSGPHLYNPSGATQAERNLLLFDSTNPGGSPVADGARAVFTIVVTEPELNPLHSFDRVPFDTWLYVRNTGFSVHIYDPDTGEYADDNNMVTNDPDLAGVYLNCGLSIPKLDWTPPASGRLWLTYPRFIDFARTCRTVDIKNRNWYEP